MSATDTAISTTAPIGRGRQAIADGTLVFVTFIWGSTFVMVKDLVSEVPPLYMLTLRMAIATLTMIVIITVARRWKGISMRELGWGVLIGIAVGFGYAFQTVGIKYTTASHAGFITGLLVVLAPIIAIVVLKQVPSRWSIIGVVFATVGLAMLSLHIEEGFSINEGDPIVLVCSFCFAFQVVLLAHTSRIYDPFRLAWMQILVAGLISGTGSMLFETAPTSIGLDIWGGAAFLGVAATAIGIAAQAYFQQFTTVVHTSIIFTLEPVFAGIFGFLLQGDQYSPLALTGAVLIVTGMLAAEIGPNIRRRVATRDATTPSISNRKERQA